MDHDLDGIKNADDADDDNDFIHDVIDPDLTHKTPWALGFYYSPVGNSFLDDDHDGVLNLADHDRDGNGIKDSHEFYGLHGYPSWPDFPWWDIDGDGRHNYFDMQDEGFGSFPKK